MLAVAVEKKLGFGLGGLLVVSLTCISSKKLLLIPTSSSIIPVLVLLKMFMGKKDSSYGAGSIETFVNRLSSLPDLLEVVEQNLPGWNRDSKNISKCAGYIELECSIIMNSYLEA
jgi:hypothetical protein